MNAGMKNGINLLMILVLFISCVQEKEDDNVLSRVEACMELFPDSALSLLSQIECPECMRGQQRADYALLLTQALDKNYLDNPLAELSQCILDSSNGSIINVI